MSDSPDSAMEGGAPTPAEADRPDEARDRSRAGSRDDEISEATPPDTREGDEAPEADRGR